MTFQEFGRFGRFLSEVGTDYFSERACGTSELDGLPENGPKPSNRPSNEPSNFRGARARYERARHLAREAEAAGRDLLDHLCERASDLLDEPDDRRVSPAESIAMTCRRRGIALRLDEDGALVIGKADGSGKEPALWPSLIDAIEAHAEPLAEHANCFNFFRHQRSSSRASACKQALLRRGGRGARIG
jgi:hypothetical protein